MSLYKPIQTDRLYEHIVEEIERRILAGTLTHGDKLPPEQQLAAQFGVSRTVVREAMRVLSQKGLVDVLSGRGTFVTNGTQQAARNSLNVLLRSEGLGDLTSLAEIREMFEPPIAAKAATRCTADQLAVLHTTIATMRRLAARPQLDITQFIEADWQFHLTLARATGNKLAEVMLNSFVGLQRDQRRRLIGQDGATDRAIFYHVEILTAIETSDAMAAHAAMQNHMTQVYERSLQLELNREEGG